MTDNRWLFLMENNSEPLTEEECAKGWHFCPSWDGLLVNPESYEGKFCSCITADDTMIDDGIEAEADRCSIHIDCGEGGAL